MSRPFPLLFKAVFMIAIVTEASAGLLRDAVQKRIDIKAQQHEQTTNMLPDLAYGDAPRQKLDVYLPEHAQNAPIILMVHGGAWRIGDKRMEAVVGNKAARWNPRGVILVSVNYRLLPTDPVCQAGDIAAALAYVQRRSASWGGDPERIVLMGHSAGAHLVSLVSADPERYKKLKPWLGTVSLDSAAMNIPGVMRRDHFDFYDDAFGSDPAFWESASPFHQLTLSAPPMLLVCSTERIDQPCNELRPFIAKGKKLGLRMKLLPEPFSHREINARLGLEGDYTTAVEQFLHSVGIKEVP
jgi:arylformamidase